MLETISHHYRHGISVYLAASQQGLESHEAVKAFSIDFEPDREEYIDIEEIEISNHYPRTPVDCPDWNPDKRHREIGEDDPITPTVGRNADKAELALRIFTDASIEPNIEEYHVSDMITDLLHFCRKAGFDINRALSRGVEAFHDEII